MALYMARDPFTGYTILLRNIIEIHGLRKHVYVDDSQLYPCFKPPIKTEQAVLSVEACILELGDVCD